ncbi:bZIP transcription factor TRAB1-like [Miscanthus floridulus]|uniref:bZIP transcription factor TRAB1-like n=1 Tax=Miscanthus floridulus TaxID=154761 RepID=UPI0034583A06
MEPQRGDEQLARAAGGGGGGNDDAGAAACLCPAAISGAARGPLLPPRHALEQEVLRRAGLQLHVGGGGGDRRRERKMKNRESAARSRARRHAYVSELEKELKEAAEVAAPATRRAPQLLRRTSSAPP